MLNLYGIVHIVKYNNHTYNIYDIEDFLNAEYRDYLEENNLSESEIDFDTWLNNNTNSIYSALNTLQPNDLYEYQDKYYE